MYYLDNYPKLDFKKPETLSYLDIWHGCDNLFRGSCRKISYKNNQCNFSIKTVLQGTAIYIVDGTEKIIEPGCFLTIRKGTKYDFHVESNEEVEDICLQITDQTLSDLVQLKSKSDKQLLDLPLGTHPHDFYLETIAFCDPAFLFLFKEIANPDTDSFERDELKTQILNYYFDHYYSGYVHNLKSINNDTITTKLEILKRINLAKDFLHSNYSKQIDLDQVSRAAYFSPSHLIRKFYEVLGITPYQYLRNLRLKKAVDLLKNTDMPVEQITTCLGFESASSFIRTFRQTYNITPNKMRKQYNTAGSQDEVLVSC